MSAKIINIKHAVKIPKSDLLFEKCRITPKMAADWLKANTLNRPVRPAHVAFLSREMQSGSWVVNGETIKIADNEDILDGQHRLLACIDAGVSFDTFVVYGLKEEAFDSIDQGIVRSGADVLSIHFPQAPASITRAVASGVRVCWKIQHGWTTRIAYMKRGNAEALAYVLKNPVLWRCASILNAYPKDARLISLGQATGLYFAFNRKDAGAAEQFMRDISTGEELKSTSVEYQLRSLFISEQRKHQMLSGDAKCMLVIKAWNCRRRNKMPRGKTALRLTADEAPPKIM